MAKPKPKTGEGRKTHQPLKIDLLPQPAKDAIQVLRDRGVPWPRIEEQSAKPWSKDWEKDGGGFVEWEAIPLGTLEEFPSMRLPKSSLQRWYDLRVSQVRAQVLAESAKAREWAAAFASKNLPDSNAAVMNAMRDQVFGMMEGVAPGERDRFLDGLNTLSLTMSRLQRVDLQARRVEVDLRRVALLEEREKQVREQIDQATQQAVKKGTGQFSLEDINLLRERTFGLPPLVIAHD